MSPGIESASAPTAGTCHGLRLFDEGERTNLAYRSGPGSDYLFFDQTALPEFAGLRETLNEWFSWYPAEAAEAFADRFRNISNKEHGGARFELFIHEHLRRSGFVSECHPKIAGSDRSPDFLVGRDGQPSFYLEATQVRPSDGSVDAEDRIAAVFAALNTIRANDWFTSVDISGAPSKAVSEDALNELVARVRGWLGRLDYHRELRLSRDPRHWEPGFDWTYEGLTLSFEASPRKELRGVDFGMFATATTQFEWYEPTIVRRIEGAFKKKARRYGALRLPLVLAINVLDNRIAASELREAVQAAWSPGGLPKHPQISGVLLANVTNIYAAPVFAPLLIENPDADKPLRELAGAFRQFTNDVRVRHDAPLP